MKKKIVALFLAACMLTGCQKASAETNQGNEAEIGAETNSEAASEIENGLGNETAGEDVQDQAEIADHEADNSSEAEENSDELIQENAQNEASQAEGEQEIILTEEKRQSIEASLTKGEFSGEPIILEEVTAYLDEKGIRYEGYYSKGKERIDLTLEDGTTLLFLETENQDMISFGYELLMVNDSLNAWGFQENYLHCYDVIIDQYYFPNLSEGVLESEDLAGLNSTDLSIARNELFAKYGRTFQDPFLNQVFRLKSWYEPKYSAQEFDGMWQDLLTETEQKNLQTIRAYEKLIGAKAINADTPQEVKMLVSGSWLDLDGNGTKEQVIYQVDEKREYTRWWCWAYEVTLVVKSEEGECSMPMGIAEAFYRSCYVTSMDGVHYYLMTADDGPSADYRVDFVKYEKGQLLQAGTMYAYPEIIEVYEDQIIAPEHCCHFQCQDVDFRYELKNGVFVKKKDDYYDYRQNVVTALMDFPLYTEKGSEEVGVTVSEGDEIKVMGGDTEHWVLIEKVSTGEEGWLYVEGLHECVLPDGSSEHSYNLMEELYFYD